MSSVNFKEITFLIHSQGDRSVGINGSEAKVILTMDINDKEWIQSVKETLKESFKVIFDDITTEVWTEQEWIEYSRSEED